MWARLKYPEGSRSGDSGWYYFDDKGIMQSGWICDKAGNGITAIQRRNLLMERWLQAGDWIQETATGIIWIR